MKKRRATKKYVYRKKKKHAIRRSRKSKQRKTSKRKKTLKSKAYRQHGGSRHNMRKIGKALSFLSRQLGRLI